MLGHCNRAGPRFDYYLLINNDAIAGPALVAELVARIGEHKDIALVSPRVLSSKPQREYGIWYHRYLGLLTAHRVGFSFHYFTGCCLLFRRDLADRDGLFDEAFFMYGEDVELAWRLTQQGKQMVCAQNA